MTWVRIDDCFPDHRKVEGLSDGAFRVIVSALCYANRNETDGRLNARDLAKLGATKKRIDELLEAGLFERDDSGIRIHDYHDYQPSKAKRQAEREATRERVAEHRAAKRNAKRNAVTPESSPEVGNAVTDGECNGGGNTAPSRPDLILSVEAAAKGLSASAQREGSSGGGDGRRHGPSAEATPIRERAISLKTNALDADFKAPEKWPEVSAAFAAYVAATGHERARLGCYSSDRGLRAIVELYAMGHTQAELERAIPRAVQSKFWEPGKHGLASLTPEVIRRALDAEPTETEEHELGRLVAP